MNAIWPELRTELQAFTIPVSDMHAMLEAVGGPKTSAELGLDQKFYHEAIRHNHEMRDRFSFVDIAADSGVLADFAKTQT